MRQEVIESFKRLMEKIRKDLDDPVAIAAFGEAFDSFMQVIKQRQGQYCSA